MLFIRTIYSFLWIQYDDLLIDVWFYNWFICIRTFYSTILFETLYNEMRLCCIWLCKYTLLFGDSILRQKWGNKLTLHWRHNECQRVSNHQSHDYLLNRLFKAQIKENIKAPRHWPLWREFTGEFPAQRASNTENVSIWWRHYEPIYRIEVVQWMYQWKMSRIVLYFLQSTSVSPFCIDMVLNFYWCVTYILEHPNI